MNLKQAKKKKTFCQEKIRLANPLAVPCIKQQENNVYIYNANFLL